MVLAGIYLTTVFYEHGFFWIITLPMIYKKCLLSFLLVFIFAFSLYSQENDSSLQGRFVGITFSSFGDNELVRFDNDLVGFPGTSGKHFYTLGLDYLVALNKTFDLETGFEYSRHKMMVDPNLPPSMDRSEYPIYLNILTVPVSARVNFLKYFFFSAGGMLNLDVSGSGGADSQTGIGARVSLGMKYDFESGISAFVNPYMKAVGLLPFVPDDYHQRLMESGWRLGILYRLGEQQ